jgi:hypothetical protein
MTMYIFIYVKNVETHDTISAQEYLTEVKCVLRANSLNLHSTNIKLTQVFKYYK